MVSKYFYKALMAKTPDWDNSRLKVQLLYIIKYYSAKGYFISRSKFYALVGWMTKYYPFSLLYQDRLFHYQNIPYRTFMERLEEVAEKSNIKIFITSGKDGDQAAEFYGGFIGQSKNNDELLNKLEKTLQDKFGTIYARQEQNKLKIIIPTQRLNQIIYPN